MNVIKYRPVGSPSGKVIRVRVTQKKRGFAARTSKSGLPMRPAQASPAMADRIMLGKGFVRAGVRHG